MVLLMFLLCFATDPIRGEEILVTVNEANQPCEVSNITYVPKGASVNVRYQNNLPCEAKICVLNEIIYTDNVDEDKKKMWSTHLNAILPKANGTVEAPIAGTIEDNYKPEKDSISFRFYYIPKEVKDGVSRHRYQEKYYAMSECRTYIVKAAHVVVTNTETPAPITTEQTAVNTTESIPVTTTENSTNTTTVNALNSNSTTPETPKWVYAVGGVGAVAAVTIIGQTAGIMYFKAKAANLVTVKNLSVKPSGPEGGNDSARYSTMPGQKATKIPPFGRKKREKEQDRESKIYETVNINMTEMKPPEPPALSTLPRLPRNKAPVNTHLNPPVSAATLRAMTPQASPMMRNIDLPRPIPATPVSQRPPIPLPIDDEHYEDVVFEKDDTYEPPPILETLHLLQARAPAVVKNVRNPIPVPPKPVDRRPPAAAALPNVAVKPKPVPKMKLPNPIHEPVTSELDTILKKRRNVMQVPVQPIPEPSTSRNNAPMTKPKPPPLVKKPIMQPPIEEPEPAYDEQFDSSDDEWTYEPLKPIDHNNIHNFY